MPSLAPTQCLFRTHLSDLDPPSKKFSAHLPCHIHFYFKRISCFYNFFFIIYYTASWLRIYWRYYSVPRRVRLFYSQIKKRTFVTQLQVTVCVRAWDTHRRREFVWRKKIVIMILAPFLEEIQTHFLANNDRTSFNFKQSEFCHFLNHSLYYRIGKFRTVSCWHCNCTYQIFSPNKQSHPKLIALLLRKQNENINRQSLYFAVGAGISQSV